LKIFHFVHSFPYPSGWDTCQFHASFTIFSMDVRDGSHPRICLAFSALAISVPGSPARREPIWTGISSPVTSLAVSIISFTENPWRSEEHTSELQSRF